MPLSSALGSIMSAIPAMPRAGSPSVPASSGPPSSGPDGAGGPFAAALAKQLSESSGAGGDPDYIRTALRDMTTKIAAMIPKVALRFADVDKHLVTAYRSLQAALAAAEKAAQAHQAANPINFSAATSGAAMGPPQATAVPGGLG